MSIGLRTTRSMIVLACAALMGPAFVLLNASLHAAPQENAARKPVAPPAPADKNSEEAEVREPSALEKEILKSTENLVKAFNDGKVDQLLETFLPDGELIDEQGTVHVGHVEIRALAAAFFEKYPGAKTTAELESVRQVGDLVLADGSRVITTADSKGVSAFRFTAIWKKTDKGYRIASFRDFSENVPPTPREALESISWMLGEWVNEGSDARVELSFRWSEDENFILADILMMNGPEVIAKSSQRIAWDASQEMLRSWTFDSDGGFGESQWQPGENEWVLQSVATSPDGTQGSATMTISMIDEDRIAIGVSDRRTDGMEEPDFEYKIVRKPPAASKAK
jgi:uncharacterized protein (TIGR02246 family)